MFRRTLLGALVAGLIFMPAAQADLTEDYHQVVPLSRDGSFSISNVNGEIEITGWDREEVEIHAVRQARNREALEEVRIEVRAERDLVAVETHLPDGRGGASVSYRVSVPRTVHAQAETVNGPLQIRGVEGGVQGSSVNGPIRIGGAAGEVRAETVNGPVEVDYARPPEGGNHAFESVNGSIGVSLPSPVAGSFHAETVNGGINTDFSLPVKKQRFGPSKQLDGQIGSGGGHYNFETVNGGIQILHVTSSSSE